MYQEGEYVIDTMNGISKLIEVVTVDFAADKDKKYYLFQPINNERSKIYLPVDKGDTQVRRVMTEEDVHNLLATASEIPPLEIIRDSDREKVYKEVIKECDPAKLISVIKNIYERNRQRIQEGKKNTIVEERYLREAQECLYTEIGFVLSLPYQQVREEYFETIFGEGFQEPINEFY